MNAFQTKPIPNGAFALTAAFQAVCEVIPRTELAKLNIDKKWIQRLKFSHRFERAQVAPEDRNEFSQIERELQSDRIANVVLRKALNRELAGFIMSSINGTAVRISGQWLPESWDYVPYGIWSDDVSHTFYDGYGPADAVVKNAEVPVFIYNDNFQHWFYATFGQTAKRGGRGRPTGSGLIDDSRRLADMHKLIRLEGKKKYAAAVACAGNRSSAGHAATVARLLRKYTDAYSSKSA